MLKNGDYLYLAFKMCIRDSSISVSGHKFGLVYPGLGWVCWKGKEHLPEEMSFSVNYLGANITQVGLNFSRPAAQILGCLLYTSPK